MGAPPSGQRQDRGLRMGFREERLRMQDKTKLVFVIGAGASKELNLPLGWELLSQIGRSAAQADQLRFVDRRVSKLLTQAIQLQGVQDWIDAANFIAQRSEGAKSIDDFLYSHQDNEAVGVIGKFLIAEHILQAERTSILQGEKLDLGMVQKSWLSTFYRELLSGRTVDEMADAILPNLTFIVFNYDRCVRRFLHQALQHYYPINRETAAKLSALPNIVHPYGTLGSLQGTPFGAQLNHIQLLKLSQDRIKTYQETVSGAIGNHITDEIDQALAIVFLGFGFHRQNMSLLESNSSVPAVFASVLGEPEPRARELLEELKHSYDARVFGAASTCDEFFRDHGSIIFDRLRERHL